MGAVDRVQRAVLGSRMARDGGVVSVAPAFGAGREELRSVMLSRGIDYRGCQRLKALGVPGKFVCALSARLAIAQDRVSVGRDFWEPVGPDARLLLACEDEAGLCDIAAVSTGAPDQVTMRTGDGWCLGFEYFERAERASMARRHVRLRVFADALEWMKGWGEGIVVLDWIEGARRLRSLGETVTIEAPAALARVVRARMERGGLPMVAEAAPEGAVLSLAERLGRGG